MPFRYHVVDRECISPNVAVLKGSQVQVSVADCSHMKCQTLHGDNVKFRSSGSEVCDEGNSQNGVHT